MQYKIPIQIENEDTIVGPFSLRQLVIMMIWGGMAYGVFRLLESRVGPEVASIPAVILAVIGVIIALVKVYEMTFLPTILSILRLNLNGKSRTWSLGTDSYSDMEIGYVSRPTEKAPSESNKTLESKMNEEVEMKIGKL